MGLFSSVSTFASLAFDSSSAALVAKEAYENGGSVSDVIRTFALETDNSVDDAVVEEICEWAEAGVGLARTVGIYALMAAIRIDRAGPKITNNARIFADAIENQGPELAQIARSVAQYSSRMADLLEMEGNPSSENTVDPLRQ
jgi:hypothetical protein